MQELMFSELSQPRFAMVLLGTFAGLAIVLTVVGLYGVMMYSVARRTREIGVRMALGARRGIVLKMVLRDAAVLLAIGIAVGVAASLISASVLQSMLYGTGSRNPLVLDAGMCCGGAGGSDCRVHSRVPCCFDRAHAGVAERVDPALDATAPP